MPDSPIAAGKSSFSLIDPEPLFDALDLEHSPVLLDLACGVGNYALAASARMGRPGTIFAFDLWREGITRLKEEIDRRKIGNISAQVVDITRQLPLPDHSADVALLATVLHDLLQIHTHSGALTEIARVLKPQGILAIVEFKKIEGPPGPPISIRLEPEALETIVTPFGFEKYRSLDLGPYHYVMLLRPRQIR
jgi:ubiquinone/menaquinone biosynthesis C-methylase UbiE